MDATGKIFQISKFPNTLSFVTISGMFRRNFTRIAEIYIPYKFIWSGCIPPKIKQDILAHKGSQTTRATPGDYLASWNRKRMGEHAGPSGVNDDEPRFPAAGTRSLLQTRFLCVCVCVLLCFFISIAQWGVGEDNTSMNGTFFRLSFFHRKDFFKSKKFLMWIV